VKRVIKSVKTRSGPDCGSDHELLVANVGVRYKSIITTKSLPKYNLENIPGEYALGVRHRFAKLDLSEKNPEEIWKDTKAIFLEMAEKYIPRQERKRKYTWLRKEAITSIARQ